MPTSQGLSPPLIQSEVCLIHNKKLGLYSMFGICNCEKLLYARLGPPYLKTSLLGGVRFLWCRKCVPSSVKSTASKITLAHKLTTPFRQTPGHRRLLRTALPRHDFRHGMCGDGFRRVPVSGLAARTGRLNSQFIQGCTRLVYICMPFTYG